ncbi:MAG: hypothetical protein H7338_04215 [Candidatus Sericytochromatia bacterium]|nr:hypothetical protein [Candidatus Sericytochromatia bacterium]
MAMNSTNSYGAAPAYGAEPAAGTQQQASASGDPAALSQSIDNQLKAYTARGAVPATMPGTSPASATPTPFDVPRLQSTGTTANAANTDPGDQGNVSWALLMEMKKSSGQSLTPDEDVRYQAIMVRANGGAAPAGSPPAAAPTAAGTDPGQQGNVTWALLMEMKKSSGQGLSGGEQARYDAIMTRANSGAAPAVPVQTGSGQTTMPTELPAGPTAAAPAATPMTQPEYNVEVKWALTFEKSADAQRYNAFNREKKIRTGAAEGKPAMDDPKFATEGAWAQTFSQTPDTIRYKRIAGEVQRRKAAGENVKPSGGMLDKVKNFFSGLIGKFTGKGKAKPAAQPAATGAPNGGQQAPPPSR